MPTRREFITRAGVLAAVGAATTGTAVADHGEAQPDHVSLTFDTDLLERYQPRLIVPDQARNKLTAIYGHIASSPEHETSVAVYWASYTHQNGWFGNLDGHYGDHEPVYVFYDANTGEPTRVMASIYHWIKGEVHASNADLYESTHPRLRVIKPWHQYTVADPAAAGAYYQLKDLTTHFDSWLANGLESSLRPGAVRNPWIMREYPYWWRDSIGGFSFTASFYEAASSWPGASVGTLEAP